MNTKRITGVLSIGIIIGFIVGLGVFLHFITTNHFVQYRIFRLAVISLQESLNGWVPRFIAISSVLFVSVILFSLMTRLILSSLHSGRGELEGRAKDGEYLLKVHFTCLVCAIFFFCGGWAINHYWLPARFHPLSLLGDAGILLFAIFLGWVLLRAKWGNALRVLRTIALVLVMFLLILNVSVAIDGRANRPKGPNVILVVVDTLRADHLSCYGYNRNTTPAVDELSEHSVLFRNAISSAPWTTPSIATAFTSQYPAALGIEAEPLVLGNELLTLAEIFKGNNYKTEAIVSHILVSSTLGFDQGFDSYDEEEAKGENYISSPSITNKAISYVENHENDKFFLFLHYFDPHHSYIMHEGYNYYPDYDGALYSGQGVEELREKAPDMSADDVGYVKALYDSEIAFTDNQIGKLFDKLKELGLYERTMIVFTADHGEEFLERGDFWIGHARKLYQEQIRVPLIMKLAGENKQEIIEEYVGLIDLMPTIVDCAGLSIPDGYRHEGETLRLSNGRKPGSNIIISETKSFADLQSLILKGWKLIYDAATDSSELYDLGNDPGETTNVAMENKEVVAEMEAVLDDWNDHIDLGKSQAYTQRPKFTEEQIERLRGLGYIH